MGSKIDVKYLNDADYDAWNSFVAKSPYGSIYSTTDYLDILCGAACGKFKIIAAMRGDDIAGGIGLYENKSRFGTFVSTRLLLYYNGLVLQDYDTKYPSQRTSRHLQILAALEEALSKACYASLQLKSRSYFYDARIFLLNGWNARLTYTYVVNLNDISAAWNRIEQNLRRLIKRCMEQGMQFSDDDDFESLYKLHAQTHERKGSPLYLPHDKFKQYFEQLKKKNLCRLYHARLPNGQAIASQLVLLGEHPVSHSVCAGTDEEFLNSGASVFLRWKVFENLSELGYNANDLTDAALNPVTRFKSQLGADLQACLMLSRPDAMTFRINRQIRDLTSQSRANFAKIAKKIMGRKTENPKLSYWQ